MANKRNFKKFINGMTANVCEDMMIHRLSVKDIDTAAVDKSIEDVLSAAAAACSEANIFFDKGPRDFEDMGAYVKAKKAFFKELFNRVTSEYINNINAALHQFNAAMPAEKRAAND